MVRAAEEGSVNSGVLPGGEKMKILPLTKSSPFPHPAGRWESASWFWCGFSPAMGQQSPLSFCSDLEESAWRAELLKAVGAVSSQGIIKAD